MPAGRATKQMLVHKMQAEASPSPFSNTAAKNRTSQNSLQKNRAPTTTVGALFFIVYLSTVISVAAISLLPDMVP